MGNYFKIDKTIIKAYENGENLEQFKHHYVYQGINHYHENLYEPISASKIRDATIMSDKITREINYLMFDQQEACERIFDVDFDDLDTITIFLVVGLSKKYKRLIRSQAIIIDVINCLETFDDYDECLKDIVAYLKFAGMYFLLEKENIEKQNNSIECLKWTLFNIGFANALSRYHDWPKDEDYEKLVKEEYRCLAYLCDESYYFEKRCLKAEEYLNRLLLTSPDLSKTSALMSWYLSKQNSLLISRVYKLGAIECYADILQIDFNDNMAFIDVRRTIKATMLATLLIGFSVYAWYRKDIAFRGYYLNELFTIGILISLLFFYRKIYHDLKKKCWHIIISFVSLLAIAIYLFTIWRAIK